jgi:hypothetical protein
MDVIKLAQSSTAVENRNFEFSAKQKYKFGKMWLRHYFLYELNHDFLRRCGSENVSPRHKRPRVTAARRYRILYSDFP